MQVFQICFYNKINLPIENIEQLKAMRLGQLKGCIKIHQFGLFFLTKLNDYL